MMKEYTFTPELAVQICEQIVSADEFEETAAWQYLIDTGLAWRLQGWYGRTAKRLIDDGYCTYHGQSTGRSSDGTSSRITKSLGQRQYGMHYKDSVTTVSQQTDARWDEIGTAMRWKEELLLLD
jgi:hypothetical protein